jgi:CubicO group peptidase (beta-lactamase class C family)
VPAPRYGLAPFAFLLLATGCASDESTTPRRVVESDVEEITRPLPDDPIQACIYEVTDFPSQVAPLVRGMCIDSVQRGIPGAVFGVVTADTSPVFVARGEACAGGSELSPDAAFRIGSVTKSLLASAVLSDGANLDQRLAERIPALAEHHPELSVRHLLQHTGGLPELAEFDTPDVVAAVAQRSPWVEPGRVWAYSNTGTGLLARWLVHEGGAVAEHIRGAIPPAAAGHIWFDVDPPPGIPATCAHARMGQTQSPTPLGLDLPWADDAEHWSLAAGGAIADVRGLLALGQHLATRADLARDWVDDGLGRQWGLGIQRNRYGQRWVFSVRGDTGTSSAELRWDDRGNVVAALSNAGGGLPTTMHEALREVFSVDPAERVRPRRIASARLAGDFSVGGWDAPVSVRADGEGLSIDLPALGSRNIHLEPEGNANAWTMERPLAPPATVSFDEVEGEIFVRGPGFSGRRLPP